MIVGLTGGICSGKTEAAQAIARLGVRVLDADVISRFLTEYEPQVLARIEQRFGARVFHEFGALDRSKLGEVVFADESERQALEAILHPPILALQHANIQAAHAAGRHLVISAPLLIESGAYRDVDHVVLVSCTTELQEERLVRRAGLSRSDAKLRISAQMPLAAKQKYADTVLDNNGSLEEFRLKVNQAFLSLFKQESHA